MLLNKARAYDVMDRHGLDGLIAATRQNIYYLSDFCSHTLMVERSFTSFAVLPRSEDAPAALVMGMTENGRLAEEGSWIDNVVGVTGRASPTAANVGAGGTEKLDPLSVYLIGNEGGLTARERGWIAAARARTDHLERTPALGLKRALSDAGLENAHIGTDDPRLIDWANAMGLDGLSGIDATNIFREIRMVKSADEIILLGEAARRNETAVETAIAAIKDGAPPEDLVRAYKVDLARQDGVGLYILFGMVPGMRHGKVVKGEPFLVDALGTYKGYHGDLGRTIFVGEPDAETKKRNRAMQIGWQTACDMMKPGLKGSDIVKKVMDVMRKEGFPSFNHCVAHTVGLEHTDHPIPIGPDGLGATPDFTIEENMVLNVDMPYQEYGWGSMHIEDTLRVTPNGFEPLTSLNTEMRIL
ncbi:MAG: aminopeptidase P family protein [Alphaproteobacteria bacterium]|nr:aminopeptidase P family protein [Alphaproteobacteria bacterium]